MEPLPTTGHEWRGGTVLHLKAFRKRCRRREKDPHGFFLTPQAVETEVTDTAITIRFFRRANMIVRCMKNHNHLEQDTQ